MCWSGLQLRCELARVLHRGPILGHASLKQVLPDPVGSPVAKGVGRRRGQGFGHHLAAPQPVLSFLQPAGLSSLGPLAF